MCYNAVFAKGNKKKKMPNNGNPTLTTCSFEDLIQCVLAQCLRLLYSRCKYYKKKKKTNHGSHVLLIPVHMWVSKNMWLQQTKAIVFFAVKPTLDLPSMYWHCHETVFEPRAKPHLAAAFAPTSAIMFQLFSVISWILSTMALDIYCDWNLWASESEHCSETSNAATTWSED